MTARALAYLRISTDRQDADNQLAGITEYAKQRGLPPLEIFRDTASTSNNWRDRTIATILHTLHPADHLIFSEISRAARSVLEVLEIVREAAEKGAIVHIVKSALVLDATIQSRIIVTVLALAAEIERDFIRTRTREALAVRRAQGIRLGRPPGPGEHLKLDPRAPEIHEYFALGLPQTSIARLLKTTPNTLRRWLARHPIEPTTNRGEPHNKARRHKNDDHPSPPQPSTDPANG